MPAILAYLSYSCYSKAYDMKRISYYFVVIGVVCTFIIGLWVYLKYIRSSNTPMLTYVAMRGSLSEVVKSRGQLAAQHDFQLGFSAAGRVLNTYVPEGSSVPAGTVLMRLDSTSAQAELAQLQAELAKLLAGATSADIAVTQAQLAAAQSALEDTRISLIESIQDAYTDCDDAVRNQADRLMIGPRSAEPHLDSAIVTNDPTLESEVEQKRVLIETLLNAWNVSVTQLTLGSDLNSAVATARTAMSQIKFYLDRMALMINGVSASTTLTQTALDAYKLNVSTARTDTINAIAAVSTAESKWRTATTAVTTAQQQLALKQEPPRPEDVTSLQAQIAAAQQNIATMTIRAPTAGTVVKFELLPGEQYAPGATAVTFYSPDMKITADISELNIGRLHADATSVVRITLDAFPDQTFTGKIISIEPQEIDKDGDKYYRVNMLFDQAPPGIRSGMSADLDIIIQTKDNVVMIPEFLVYSREGTKYVRRMVDDTPTEQEVTLGISDSERVEILSGISEGDIIAASTD